MNMVQKAIDYRNQVKAEFPELDFYDLKRSQTGYEHGYSDAKKAIEKLLSDILSVEATATVTMNAKIRALITEFKHQ